MKKVSSGDLGQVNSLSGQVIFHSHLPDRQEIRQVVCHATKSLKEQNKTCPGQSTFESYLSEGQAGNFEVFKSCKDKEIPQH